MKTSDVVCKKCPREPLCGPITLIKSGATSDIRLNIPLNLEVDDEYLYLFCPFLGAIIKQPEALIALRKHHSIKKE
jgi:hypothetical protein